MRRELNEIEYFNWCFGQPYNMVVAVRLRGELDAGALRAALDQAQLRHPLLRVNTDLGASGMPWFSSDGVGPIPLRVERDAEPDDARRLAERELTSSFAMDEPGRERLPLLRVALFLPRERSLPIELVFTVQHVVADGLSMVFLVRDVLRFIDDPCAPIEVLDAPASALDLFPPRVRRRIPRSPFRFKLALWLAKLYVRLRFGAKPELPKRLTTHHRSWVLSAETTEALRARCKRERVSVQSAICTAFLPEFRAIHTPVSVRGLLARDVGESVGLYVGSADVKLRYIPRRSFWANARRFHRRLRRALRDPFRLLRLFSKAVPLALVRELGPLLMRITGADRPFAVTNLRRIDDAMTRGRGRLAIESFSGAVTSIIDSSVLTVYTVGGRMHLHLLAGETAGAPTAVRDDAERALARLRGAIEQTTVKREEPSRARPAIAPAR
jgi:hypothetical protein